MATVSFDLTTQVATVLAPDTTITIQDLYNQWVAWEDNSQILTYRMSVVAGGKFNYGTGQFTVVSLKMVYGWRLAFEARPGPTLVGCEVTGGNLASEDAVGAPQWPIKETSFVSVGFAQATTGAILEDAATNTAIQNLETDVADLKVYARGKKTVSDTQSKLLIVDNVSSRTFEAVLWSDEGETVPFTGGDIIVQGDVVETT